MPFKLRATEHLHYQLTCIGLLAGMGIFSLAIILLEPCLEIISTFSDTATNYDALYATLIVMGGISILSALMMLSLMYERRNPHSDRRQRVQDINFEDRRINADRRSGKHT